MKSIISQTSKEDLEDLLKKLLHQNGMCLLIYPQGSNTSLLTALAQTIHTNEQILKEKLVQKLQYDYKHRTLPKKLHYIYDDQTIIDDFRKYPELVRFSKIILELFSSSSQRRLNLFTLIPSNKNQYNLSCLIINQKGYSDSISIARIYNKYYNIKARNVESRNQLSLQEAFKSSNHFDSDQLIQTFKSESLIHKNLQKINEVDKPEETKSTTKIVHIDEIEEPLMNLKRAKSTMPYREVEANVMKNEHDRISLGDHLQHKQDTQLINQCNNGSGVQNFDVNAYQNNHIVPMTPEQMYYHLYYSQTYNYSAKPENYVNYQQSMPIHPLSPSKNQPIYKQPVPLTSNYYASSNYNAPSSTIQQSQPSDNSEKRYAGRLKFFDDAKNYGFIIMDADQSDIFVHYDDLQKAGISKDIIKSIKNEMYLQIRFNFKVMQYFGKYKKSRKAVQLIIIDDGLINLNSFHLTQ